MKTFLRKRWHRIPVGIIGALMAVLLIATSVFAAYNFFTLTTEIEVTEPMEIEYNLDGKYSGDSAWHTLGDTDSLTLQRSAGDDFDMRLRFTNHADNPLTINTVISGSGQSYFTFTGFPSGGSFPHGQTIKPVSVDTDGDAPPGKYGITFAFTRS